MKLTFTKFKLINFESYEIKPEILGLYRIIYCIIIMVFIGLPSFSWLSNNLNYFFHPPFVSLASMVGGFPGKTFFGLLTLINIIIFYLMFLGVWSKWTSLFFTVVSLIGYNFWYSFGKIDHFLFLFIAPAFLGFAGWGSFFTINKYKSKIVDPNKSALIVSLLALCIAFSMFTSGSLKIEGGWWKWDTEAVRYHLIRNYFSLERNELLADFFITIKNHLIWKFFDYSALLLEIGFLFSIMNKRYFQFFLFFGTIFHIIILLMFNIAFYSNLLIYLLFIDWGSIFRVFKINYKLYQKRYTNALYIIFLLGTILSVYWVCYLLYTGSAFLLPGLIDIMAGNDKLQFPSILSLILFFGLAFIVVLFSLALYIKNFNHSVRIVAQRKGIMNILSKFYSRISGFTGHG